LDFFEGTVADELEENEPKNSNPSVTISLLYPHWRAGTLPLSNSVSHIFPTALESSRVRFTFHDEETDEVFNGWVIRKQRYVFGLREWYEKKGAIPGQSYNIKKRARNLVK